MHISISWIRNRGLIIAKHIRTWFWGQLGLVSCSNNEIMTYHWRSCISIKDHHWPDIVVHNHFRSLMLVHSGCLLSIKPEILAEKTHLRPHWVTRLEWHLRMMQRRKVFRKCTSNTLSWYWRGNLTFYAPNMWHVFRTVLALIFHSSVGVVSLCHSSLPAWQLSFTSRSLFAEKFAPRTVQNGSAHVFSPHVGFDLAGQNSETS